MKAKKTRNPFAEALSNALFRAKVIKPKKGKGAYRRKKRKESLNG